MAVENRCSPYSGTNALRARTMETNKFCRLATRQHDSAEAVESEKKNVVVFLWLGFFVLLMPCDMVQCIEQMNQRIQRHT